MVRGVCKASNSANCKSACLFCFPSSHFFVGSTDLRIINLKVTGVEGGATSAAALEMEAVFRGRADAGEPLADGTAGGAALDNPLPPGGGGGAALGNPLPPGGGGGGRLAGS